MKSFRQILKQIGRALEFSNHVGSPTALHQLLAQQALHARAASSQPPVVPFNQTPANATNDTSEIPRLVCVR